MNGLAPFGSGSGCAGATDGSNKTADAEARANRRVSRYGSLLARSSRRRQISAIRTRTPLTYPTNMAIVERLRAGCLLLSDQCHNLPRTRCIFGITAATQCLGITRNPNRPLKSQI